MRKRPLLRKAFWAVAIVALIWLVISFGLALSVLIQAQVDEARPADTIIVLGSGLRRDGQPGPALTRRSAHAADLYYQGYADTIICTGGYTSGRSRSEASGCQQVLMSLGVPENAILLEERSRSTEENALFAHEIMRERGLTDAVLVSDGYHLLRAGWIFAQEGIPVYPSPSEPTRLLNLGIATVREIAALHWQLVKSVLNLPNTYVPLI